MTVVNMICFYSLGYLTGRIRVRIRIAGLRLSASYVSSLCDVMWCDTFIYLFHIENLFFFY